MDVEDLPELKEIKELHRALKKADEDWIASFRDTGGVAGIYKVIGGCVIYLKDARFIARGCVCHWYVRCNRTVRSLASLHPHGRYSLFVQLCLSVSSHALGPGSITTLWSNEGVCAVRSALHHGVLSCLI